MSLVTQLLEAHDEQRRRLARDLHSNASQHLAALQFNLGLMAQAPGISQRVPQALSDSMALAAECALEIRKVSYALHPPLLDELGLIAALSGASELRKIRAELPESLGRLPPHIEIALYRIIEDALPRISKLRVHRDEKSVTLELNLRTASPVIRERVKALKGRISRGGGMLRVTVPVKAKVAKS